jgi:hypothetical protein
MDAGQACRGQQLRECALRLPGFERDTIQKKLVIGDAEQEAAVAAKRLLQFRPRGSELTFGALVVDPVEPRVLDENIEAVDEGTRGGAPAGIGLLCARDSFLQTGSEWTNMPSSL